MTDVFTTKKRSEVMSHIRGKGNKETELRMMAILRAHHLSGWRRNQPVAGKPDFVFQTGRVALFVDGCFWHRCPKHSSMPANNRVFWQKKLNANVLRDHEVNRLLRAQGWKVLRVWEHELSRPEKVAARVAKYI